MSDNLNTYARRKGNRVHISIPVRVVYLMGDKEWRALAEMVQKLLKYTGGARPGG